MYKTILVATDIEDGRSILKELEKRQLQITAAFWFHYEDDWKLVVVSPDVSEKGPRSLYTMISKLLHGLAKDPQKSLQFPLDRIMLVSPYSLLYKMVKQRIGASVGPTREGLTSDAYIYKMT
jgi:hypothetical protein